jgi:serine/threonine-protein kinase SRPK3
MGEYEAIQFYCADGYHPVHLGDRFKDNRYIVEHKLGYGGYSTVWLARDLREQRLVALKILTAIDSRDPVGDPESGFLRRLNPQFRSSRWSWIWRILPFSWEYSEFFPVLLDEFTVNGPNGTHRCIVTEVLGPSLSNILSADELQELPVSWERKIALQLTRAVATMHERGVVHGGMTIAGGTPAVFCLGDVYLC